MITITLPDGNKRSYKHATNLKEIAFHINPKTCFSCIAGYINDRLISLDQPVESDATVKLITLKNEQISLYLIRIMCLIILGHAIKSLYPKAKMGRRATSREVFHYDVDVDNLLTVKEVNNIEKHMKNLINQITFTKVNTIQEEARQIFFNNHDLDKSSIFKKKSPEKNITLFLSNEDLLNIPETLSFSHVQLCKNFKLTKISKIFRKKKHCSFYRIYGTAWSNEKDLMSFLKRTKEAERRDHRKLNNRLNLYHMQEEAPGTVFWHEKGWTIFLELEKFIRDKLKKYRYREVKSPLIMDRNLWKKTGHWENYQEAMFSMSSENHNYCIKPMNCPGHIQIFNQGIKSYRNLPLRIAEFGSCYRNEPSGSLHGLMRLRGFTQDDAHIFCSESQIEEEINLCITMLYEIYWSFKFKKIEVNLSTRPERRIGDDKTWDDSEKKLESVLKKNNIPFKIQEGEGAFYGSKIEFTLYDSLDRAWQCGTIQLDFSLPKKLGAFYIDEHNRRQTPVLIHRAMLGSIERFIGVLLEEYIGYLPTWLSPVQVVTANINASQKNYTKLLTKKLLNLGIRVQEDIRDENIGLKIRDHIVKRVPYILICGKKELQEEAVTVRTFKGNNIGSIKIENFIKKIKQEIDERSFDQLKEE